MLTAAVRNAEAELLQLDMKEPSTSALADKAMDKLVA
jgi:hypothetical protein